MDFRAYILLFPLVLALHNLDEYARYEQFVSAYHPRLPARFTTRRVVLIAAAGLTLASALISVLTYLLSDGWLVVSSKLSVLSLFANAVGHCIVSLRRRRLLPGTLSACVLVLPYGLVALVLMRNSGASVRELVAYAALGAALVPITVFVFIRFAYLLARFIPPLQRRSRR